jgi:PAS domain S-box-containing protein
MKKHFILLFCICISFLYPIVLKSIVFADDPITLRVGIYENQPKIFTDEQGKASGFWVDIFDYVASNENWTIEYVPGTWEQCLSRLQNGEIDILPDVAYSEERSKLYDFSEETVYVSWSRVYTHKGVDIQSVLDLDGKTIAVLKGSINVEGPEGIKKLVNAFDLDCSFVEVDSYIQVLNMVQSGEVDAGVTSKDFGHQHESEFRDIIKTAVIFQPSLLYFAFPKDSSLTTYLVGIIDPHIKELKDDSNSVYYHSLEKWLGVKPLEKTVMPDWMKWLLGCIGGLALLLAGGSWILRSQVRLRTKQLTEEIAERKKAEDALKESEKKYRSIYDESGDGIVLVDSETGYIIDCNPEFERQTGRSLDQLKKMLIWKLRPLEQEDKSREIFTETKTKGIGGSAELAFQRPDGKLVPIDFLSKLVTLDGKQYLQSMTRDITKRKQMEQSIAQTSRALKVLSQCNQVLIRSTDESELLNEICHLIVGIGGYRLTWVGFAEQDEAKTVRPVAQRGYEDGYLDTVKITWADNELGQGPTGTAIRTGKPCVARDILDDPSYKPWRVEAEKRGYLSCAAFPLACNEQIFGVLNIYAIEPASFNKEEIELLMETADDLAYGIMSLRSLAEKKLAEEQLKRSEARYSTLVEKGNDGIIIIQDGLLKFANTKMLEMSGYTAGEVYDKSFLEFCVTKYRNAVEDRYNRRISGKKAINNYEIEILSKSGNKIPVEINASIIEHEGEPANMAIVRDITDRRRIEDELRKLSHAVEQSPVIVMITDRMGIVEYVNPKFESVTGYAGKETIGDSSAFLSRISREEADLIWAILNSGKVWQGEFNIQKKDGEYYWESAYIAPVKDNNGNITHFIKVAEDITERKQIDEKLIVTDRLASIGELASGIAHELNNPLTSVIGFSELLLKKDIPEDVREELDIIYSEAQRAVQVMKNLLSFARKHHPKKEKVKLNEIIEKVLELRTYEEKVSNIKVIRNFDNVLPEIDADYFQLQQVFFNIVVNAEHAMIEAHGRGVLTITTEKKGNSVRISIADSGPGISQQNLSHIFDPFFTTKEVGKGTGLGLSICHGIITAHGGQIYAKSKQDKGAIFIVELPV